MLRSRSLLVQRTAVAALLCGLAVPATAHAQARQRWMVDSKASLAWWQVEPNMKHLWGTTCPQEPSWRPGEGRSGGWTTEEAMNAKGIHGFSDVVDTIHVPLYPRRRVRFVCSEAITGEIIVGDSTKLTGAHGELVINPKMLVTGENMRDEYSQKAILGVASYPEIKYTLDSIVGVSRKADTIRATAWGTYQLRGVTKPVTAPFTVWPEAGGARVLAKFGIPVHMLIDDFGVWKRNLGLGVMMGIWKTLYMGVDLLVHSNTQGQAGQ